MRNLAFPVVASLMASITLSIAGLPLTANLRASGAVVVNAVPVPDGATLRAGDTLATGFDSLAIVSSPSTGRLELRADSEARLSPAGLVLTRGAAAANRLAIWAGRYSIQPAGSAPAWYAVARRDGRLLVAAHRGNVLIAALGEPPVLVPEGSYAQNEQDETPPPPPRAKTQRHKGARPAAGTASSTSSGGWTIGGLSHTASVVLVVGVGAGVAAVTAGVVSLGGSGPSPDD